MDFEQFALWYITLIVSLVVHEAAHAWVAYLGGDMTAYVGGQVTLNPIPHMRREPFGTIVLPIAVLILSKGSMCFGFAHTPIDARWAHKHPRRAALMSVAGPLSNLLIAAIAFSILKSFVSFGLADPTPSMGMFVNPIDDSSWVAPTAKIASFFLILNLLLAILNLFPWPPFDGAGVVGGLSRSAERFYAGIRTQVFLQILGLLVAWELLDYTLKPVVYFVRDLLNT
ncbi:MAG: site-2 protease family protein [Planctomycetes bacterium]|nr:site-2 protease family protein [Planctomycetota bacterium]